MPGPTSTTPLPTRTDRRGRPRHARPTPPPLSPTLTLSEPLRAFIESCAHALDVAFDDPRRAEMAPGVDVDDPGGVVLAFLVFTATTNAAAGDDERAVQAWHAGVSGPVWEALGFPSRGPERLTLTLAFALLTQRAHQAPELRSLLHAVEQLAASGLLSEVRS